MLAYPFREIIADDAALRALVGQPKERTIKKEMPALDRHCRVFIERSPLLLLGTCGASGRCDVSPRGDAPGFVLVLDDQTLIIPERPGNRRVDSLANVIQNPHVGLLFLIPNMEETLRVNGRAAIVRDADLLDRMAFRGKTPLLGIAVEVEEAFMHCAKAFKRSALWQPETWPDRSLLPSFAQMLVDQAKLTDTTVEQLECEIDESYRKTLY